MKKVKTGILGCGAISPAYLSNLTASFTGVVDVIACADMIPEAAKARADEFGIPKACSFDQLLADTDTELIVNLTPAPAHHETSLRILQAGKHLFTEKPLALSCAQAREILQTATSRNLLVAGASDTFLSAGLQRCRQLIDDGRIGIPVAATTMVTIGQRYSERYHQVFRGALLDLGPYYIGALVALLGPVSRVTAAAGIRFPEKTIPDGFPNSGKTFQVDLPTTVAGSLDFVAGPVASVVASCDVHGYYPWTQILGTDGTLLVNDANGYQCKPVLRTRDGEEVFDENPGFSQKGRGLGVAEMAMALRENRPPRADGEHLYHILEVMLAFEESSQTNQHIHIDSCVERPAPFNADDVLAST